MPHSHPEPEIIEVSLHNDDRERQPHPLDLLNEGLIIWAVGWETATGRCYKVTAANIRWRCTKLDGLCALQAFTSFNESGEPIIELVDVTHSLPDTFKVARGMPPHVEECQEARYCYLRSQ